MLRFTSSKLEIAQIPLSALAVSSARNLDSADWAKKSRSALVGGGIPSKVS
jgi:hypothetical protein